VGQGEPKTGVPASLAGKFGVLGPAMGRPPLSHIRPPYPVLRYALSGSAAPEGYFRVSGSGSEDGTRDQAKGEAVRERIEYMRYLSRIYEVIRAAQITVQPLLDKAPGAGPTRSTLSEVQSGLQNRLGEFDALLQSDSPPMPLHTFDGVSRLHSTLLFFVRVAKNDPHSAVEDLRQNAPTDFSSFLASLTAELGTLKEQA
jgi:hypothetical protein